MQTWKVTFGKKVGTLDAAALHRSVRTGKLPTDAFLRPESESSDWTQVATVEWLVEVPEVPQARYCLECDCRVVVALGSDLSSVRCPSCTAIGLLTDYLDGSIPEAIRVGPEPWGKYDLIACAFAVLLLLAGVIGVFTLIANPALSVLIGFILTACGAGLFVVTFQHRGESSKYREHLKKVESALDHQTNGLVSADRELQSLKRNLTKVRDDLIAATQQELDYKRRQIDHELECAKDQYNAVHRMAERFLTETRKWWTSKLTGQNYPATKERLMKAIEFCRKQGYKVTATQEREILRELKTDYELVLKKEHEKAEQIRVREQMREEQRVQREMKREIERVERESAKRESEKEAIERALAAAMQRVGAEHSAEVQRLQQSLIEAERKALAAQEAAQRTKSQAELTKVGNVYVISNPGSFGENAFKVGLTRRLDPTERVRELGDASVPFPFDIHMMIRSDDAPALEKKLHKALHRYRVNRVNFRKEFFRVDLDTIRQAIEKHHGKIDYEYEGGGLESEYEQSLRTSDADFAYLAQVADVTGLEDDDDDMDGLDDHGD